MGIRDLIALLAGFAAVPAILVVLGGGGGPGVPSLTPVARAAERTAEYPGARVKFTGLFHVPGEGAVMDVEGRGEFNGRTGRFRMSLASASSAAVGESLEMEQVGEQRDGRFVMYMRSPMLRAGLPGGAEWLKVDLSDVTSARGQSLDPRRQLEALRSSTDLEALGTERIRGVRTTRYRGTIDQGKAVDELRDEGKDETADLMEKVIDDGPAPRMQVWVGPDDTVHRMQMDMSFSVMAQGSSMQMTMDLYDFGAKPDIGLPGDGQAFDATERVREAMEQLEG